MTEILIMNWIYRNRTAMKQLHRPIRNAAKQEVAAMLGRNADTFQKIALGTVAIATVLMSAAGAYAIEPFLQGFSAPVGIHAYGGTSLLVSNWSGGTVERVQADGRRSGFLHKIGSPAGHSTDPPGARFGCSLFCGIYRRVGPGGKGKTVVVGLATPH